MNNPPTKCARIAQLAEAKKETFLINHWIRDIVKEVYRRSGRVCVGAREYHEFYSGLVTFQGLKNFMSCQNSLSREVAEAVLEAAVSHICHDPSVDRTYVLQVINFLDRIQCGTSRKKRMMAELHSIFYSETALRQS